MPSPRRPRKRTPARRTPKSTPASRKPAAAGKPARRTAPARKSAPATRTRRPASPAQRRSRRWKQLGAVLVTVVVLGIGWFAGGGDLLEDLLPDQAQAGPVGEPSEVDAAAARGWLAELTVAESASMSGYSRDRFSHWRSVDGCDARQTVLNRDGADIVQQEDSCRVVSGTWYSPFDEVTLTDPGDIDIDHLVPLANSWRTGAAAWDDDRRAAFANDLDTPQLIAVSASSNRAKGDQDPSQWKPARSYWCQYAHDWVVVKHYWELWVTEAERDALTDMLDTCS